MPEDVGTLLQLDSGTLSPLLKRLEAQGLVARPRNPQDERALTVSLTPRGQALREQAERIPSGSSPASGWRCPSSRTCTGP